MEAGLRILLWHGYLLTGSGSNLYTANLARVWRRQGHDVLVMCQERDVGELDFIDSHGDIGEVDAEIEFRDNNSASPESGRCRLLRPNIGGLLPVYVYDEYEGFEVKRFVDLSLDELSRYIELNFRAMRAAIERFEPEAIIVGHEVMGPYIALMACVPTRRPYLAKLHGSALEYAVKPQDRYRTYATEGLGGARVVVGGSKYMLEEAASVVPGWRKKGVVVNPGCDVELFRPRERAEPEVPTVGYVGKLMASKGVHNLLVALGLTKERALKVSVVGYGGFESQLRDLWSALRAGDAPAVAAIAAAGEDGLPLEELGRFVSTGGLDKSFVARLGSIDLTWHGRLDHGPLAQVLPDFGALVAPSVVPEAFGMVGAEAAACGVLPLVPGHSGIGEIGAALEGELGRPGFLTFDPQNPIAGIAHGIDRILDLRWERRSEYAETVSGYAHQVWSWETVADQLLHYASGR
jgi:glycosyltransferase involved in cell wall biosynthesis